MSLTTAQAGTVLGVPEPTIRQWVHRGKLAPIRRGTRPLLFDQAAVDAIQAGQWRAQQRAAASWIGHAAAEYEEQVAADLRVVSRCGHAQPSREPVEGTPTTTEPPDLGG